MKRGVCWLCVSGGADSSDDVAARRHVDQWWNNMLTEEDRTCLELSGKLVLLFNILALAQQMGDKVSVFLHSSHFSTVHVLRDS